MITKKIGSETLPDSSEIPCPALDNVFSKHQAYYLEKLLQVERLDHQKWTEFIQTHCDILLKEVELEPSIDRDKINMDITDLIKIKCISQGRVFMSLYSTARVIYNTYRDVGSGEVGGAYAPLPPRFCPKL